MNIKYLSVILFLHLFFIADKKLFAQNTPPNLANEPSVQSPSASGLGKFGDIPVSLFNGLLNISIPISEIKNGDITVPINISYYAGGNRPDQHPSWVGLGWSLQVGGLITRHSNGYFDESILSIKNSYYDRYTYLAADNWYNIDPSQAGPDLAPDEFSFSFNGISGSFMLNHEGKWVVKSKENINLKIEHEIQENYALVNPTGVSETLPRSFTKFILTTHDGTKYIFGGDQKAIEFSRPSLPTMVESYNASGPAGEDRIIRYDEQQIRRNIQSTAWHLSEIISTTGRSTKFYYSTAFNFKQATYTEISRGPNANNGRIHYKYDVNQNSQFLINSSYLDKIEANNNISCVFSKSFSNELSWRFKSKSQSLDDFGSYAIGQSGGDNKNVGKYYKLDGIEIKVNNTTVKKVSFNYIEKNNERLKLKEVNFFSTDNQIKIGYKIEYNTKLLPDYNIGQEDHWGFYNGRNHWGTASGQYQVAVPDLNTYYQSREADPAYMDAEIINKITYPTGGYSEFYFEPHDYSAIEKQNSTISLLELDTKKIAGGLRISKIKSYDSKSNNPVVKEYYYVKDFINGGILSSGVLAGEPNYYESGSNRFGSFIKFSSNTLNYLNTTNGNHVTYSEVVEKNQDQGYTIHTFTNYNNGYLDKEPFTQMVDFTSSSMFDKKLYGKLDLERGLPLKISYYSKDKIILKEKINEYDQNTSKYNSFVRAYQNVASAYAFSYNIVAYPIYTFYPTLLSQTETEYNLDGSSISIKKEYTYNATYKKITSESMIDSEGQTISTLYKYPFDMVNGLDPSGTYRFMVDANILAPVVEESVQKNGEQITLKRINYIKPHWNKNFYIPQSIQVKQYNNPIETKVKYNLYDTQGNVLEIQKENNIPESYFWGYQGQYLVAKVTGIDHNTAKQYINQAVLGNPINDQQLRDELNKLRINLPNALVITYTYAPLIGITSETDPTGVTIYYEYDNLNRLKMIKDQDFRIVKSFFYHYKK